MSTAALIGSDRNKMHVGLSLFSFTRNKNIRLAFCDDSMLVPVYKIGEVHFPLLGTNGFHAKAKNERFTATGSCCRQNLQNRNISRRRLPDYVKHCTKRRAARAARLFFLGQWSISLIYGVNIVSDSSKIKGKKRRL